MSTINVYVDTVVIGGPFGGEVEVDVPRPGDVSEAVRGLTLGLDPLREAAIHLLAVALGRGSDAHYREALLAARELVDRLRAAMSNGYRLTGEADEGALSHYVAICGGSGEIEPKAIAQIAVMEDLADLHFCYLLITQAIIAAGLQTHGEDA